MADILLTHSYFLKFDPKEYRARMPYAPLGTLYAAAQLRRAGYSVALFDSMLAETEQEIVPMIKHHQPAIVVIYDDDFNYLSKMCLSRMRDAAFSMTRLSKELGCTVIAHGSDASDHPAGYLDHGADYVISGEGEETLLELTHHLLHRQPRDIAGIRGLAHRKNGNLCLTGSREVMSNLDELAFPARDLIDAEKYRSEWRQHHGYYSMNMVTTRGCPFHCNWCSKPIYGQVYHSRSPENVVEEMSLLKRDHRPDHLWFCDDIFGLKPGWVQQFADAVERRQAQIPFKCLSRADLLLKEGTIGDLRRSGCETVWIGAESGSQKILDAMEKGTSIEQIYRSTKSLRKHGIRVGFFLQYGYPGETLHEIDLTLKMVKECNPDEIGISVSYPLPGTKFFERVKLDLREKQNWVDSQDLDLMYRGFYTADFYRMLHTVTHKKFRIWQGMKLMKQALAHPSILNRRVLRRIVATGYHALTLPRYAARLNSLASAPNTAGSTLIPSRST